MKAKPTTMSGLDALRIIQQQAAHGRIFQSCTYVQPPPIVEKLPTYPVFPPLHQRIR